MSSTPEARTKPPCATCFQRPWCLPATLHPPFEEEIASVWVGAWQVARGQSLAAHASTEGRVFIVRSGAFKSEVSIRPGVVQVLGLHEAGDFMAIEPLLGLRAWAERTATQDSTACAFDVGKLQVLADAHPPLHRLVDGIRFQALGNAYAEIFALGSLNATERLAWFILRQSEQRRLHGQHARMFVLSMTREDIGNYLSLRLETVSRTLSTMARCRLIRCERRTLHILDMAALAALANMPGAAIDHPPRIAPVMRSRQEMAESS